MANSSMVTYKQSSSIAPVYKQELYNIGNNITECLKKIKDTEGKACDAKNITGIFKGKNRDDALADALVMSAETQTQTVTLIQEVVKLFLYCFKMQEETNLERTENIFNYIISMTDDEETVKFLNEMGEVFSSYQSSIRLRIEEIRGEIGLTDAEINNVRDIATDNSERIAAAEEKNAEHDKRLDDGDQKDKSQDEELSRQAEKDAEHDKRLDAGDRKDKSQDEELSRQAEKDAEHDEKIKALEDKVAALENTCNQLSETIKAFDTNHINNESELRSAIDGRFTRGASVASAIVGALGLIAAIIGFFI